MSLLVVLSEVSDGSMYDPSDKSNKTIIDNRKRFLKEHSIKMQQTTRLDITYNEDDFCKYREVSSKDMGAGMSDANVFSADALITRSTNHALFLPLADCVGTVIYDKRASILMLTHLGRQSVEQDGGRKSVEYLVTNYGSIAEDLLVWLAPAPGKEKYPLYASITEILKKLYTNNCYPQEYKSVISLITKLTQQRILAIFLLANPYRGVLKRRVVILFLQ
jgi:copper oxidase (laccase) domain-containing protein